jgi:hypothetical protein
MKNKKEIKEGWSIKPVGEEKRTEKDSKCEYVVIKRTYLIEGEGRTYKLEFERITDIDASLRHYVGRISAYVKVEDDWFGLTYDETMYVLGSLMFEFFTKSVYVGGI